MKIKAMLSILSATRRIAFCARLRRSAILRPVVVLIAVLAWTSHAFCGEIHDAARDGDLAKIRVLLKENPDLVFSKGSNGATPLHFASDNDHCDIARFLLAHKADVNSLDNDNLTPLHYAAHKGYKDMAELLLLNKADVNVRDNSTGGTPSHKTGGTSLHWAAGMGYKDVVELLLAHKANVNAKANDGETPLHLASEYWV